MSEDEITKERIFLACEDRFLKEGFVRISVDEISANLGMSKKTFYKYFSSKEDVVQQMIDRVRGAIRGNVERILLDNKSTVEKLSEFITVVGTTTGRLTPTFGQDIQRRMPQLWASMVEFRRQRVSEVFTRLLSQGVAEGSIRPDLNHRVFLLCVLGAIDL